MGQVSAKGDKQTKPAQTKGDKSKSAAPAPRKSTTKKGGKGKGGK